VGECPAGTWGWPARVDGSIDALSYFAAPAFSNVEEAMSIVPKTARDANQTIRSRIDLNLGDCDGQQ
jgi:hypothetical protein